MDNADLIFEDICMSLDLLKYRSVCVSSEAEARLKGLPCPAVDRKKDIPTKDHGALSSLSLF